jgi:hypothetical protein
MTPKIVLLYGYSHSERRYIVGLKILLKKDEKTYWDNWYDGSIFNGTVGL